jgi:hypothetical protein
MISVYAIVSDYFTIIMIRDYFYDYFPDYFPDYVGLYVIIFSMIYNYITASAPRK